MKLRCRGTFGWLLSFLAESSWLDLSTERAEVSQSCLCFELVCRIYERFSFKLIPWIFLWAGFLQVRVWVTSEFRCARALEGTSYYIMAPNVSPGKIFFPCSGPHNGALYAGPGNFFFLVSNPSLSTKKKICVIFCVFLACRATVNLYNLKSEVIVQYDCFS